MRVTTRYEFITYNKFIIRERETNEGFSFYFQGGEDVFL